MAKAAKALQDGEEGSSEALTRVNGGTTMVQTPGSVLASRVGRAITRPWCKVLVLSMSLGLFAFTPYGISQVTPDYGPRDFVKGCGVFCDPSYLLDFVDEHDASFDRSPLTITLMVEDFDINAHYSAVNTILTQLRAPPGTAGAHAGSEACPDGCMVTANGMREMSWMTGFCGAQGADARKDLSGVVQGCGNLTARNVDLFLKSRAGMMFKRDVKLPANLQSSVLAATRLYYPMRNYDTTEDSMKALLATNEIIDDANSRHPFKATAFGPQFTVFSMFGEAPHKALLSRACDRVLTPSACTAPCTTVRIQDLLYASLAWALAVAFFIMLLSVHVGVALIIACIVVVVDSDLLAAVYYFDNNMAPFTFAAVVISVGASSQHTG
jgi:hypothetical protein